jgi:hypothetical protein
MDWLQSSLMPHPELSALRSSLNRSPRAMQKDEIATKIDTRPKNTRKDSTQQIMQMPKKDQNTSNQITTPVKQIKPAIRMPNGSPFDTIEQTNNDIDAIHDTWAELGMNNYTTSTPNMNMAYNPNFYVPGSGLDNYSVAYYNGNEMGNPNLQINTDPASVFGATGFINSPDEYNTSAGTDILDKPLNFLPNMTYVNNIGGMLMVNNSGASTQQYSQASVMPVPPHTDSFDSMATTTHGSQTDEANQYLNVDGGNDSQVFDDGTTYTNLDGGSFDDHFGDLFPDGRL